jgi:hypothetical protein
VTPDNLIAFKKRRLRDDLSKYDHIEIIFLFDMRATTVTSKNHFETITFDRSKLEYLNFPVCSPAGWLITASSSARLMVLKDRIDRDINTCRPVMKMDLNHISEKLGLHPKRKYDARMQYWIWERTNGDKFSWDWSPKFKTGV